MHKYQIIDQIEYKIDELQDILITSNSQLPLKEAQIKLEQERIIQSQQTIANFEAQIKLEQERLTQAQQIIAKFEAEFRLEAQQEVEIEELRRLHEASLDTIKAVEQEQQQKQKQKSRLASDTSLYAQKEDELLKLERWFSKCREKYTDFDVEGEGEDDDESKSEWVNSSQIHQIMMNSGNTQQLARRMKK